MSPDYKNIALFSLAWEPFEGGAEIAAREVATRMEHAVTVLTYRFDARWSARADQGHLSLRRVGGGRSTASYYGRTLEKWLYVYLAWRAAEKIHKQKPFTHIWGLMASYGGIAALLFKLRHPHIPFLLTLQEGDSERHIIRRVGIFYPLWRQIFLRADRIHAISSYLKDFAVRQGARCPVVIIPNGVDTDNFQFSISNFQKKQEKKIIITTSRLVYKNGVDILIRACALLPRDTHELHIIGDGPERKTLERLTEAVGIAPHTRFYGQVVSSKIPEALRAAHMFVRPSRSEGLGSSFLEAMASGVPVIGTPVGGIPDFLEDRKTGLFVRPDDPHDLAEKMKELLENDALYKKISQHARTLIQADYAWDDIGEKVATMIATMKARERIVIASGILPPEVGGPAYYATELATALAEMGVEVRLCGYGWLKRLPTGVRHMLYTIKLLPIFIFWQPTFVIALDMFSVGLPAVLLGKFTKVPVVIRTGGDFLWEFYVERTGEKILLSDFYTHRRAFTKKEKLIFNLTRWTLHHARMVVFSTTYQRDICVSAYGLDISRTAIIENRYEIPITTERTSQKNFICLTRPLAWKNIDMLQRAFAKARVRSPEISLETGSFSHTVYKEKLEKCYAVVLVSLGDISPNMILEALAMGKPFILTTENGLENRLSGIGMRVNPLDEQAIEDALVSLANDEVYSKEKKKLTTFSFQHTYKDIAREFMRLAKRL